MDDKIILLVEDNPDDVELTLRAFRQNRISNNIVVARDGAEAIDYIMGTGFSESPDMHETPVLILLDLKLPKIDGLEVLKTIRNHEPTRLIPVVILTSSIEDKDVLNGYNLGANSYVRKPVDFKEFVETMKLMGLYWLICNKPVPPHLKK